MVSTLKCGRRKLIRGAYALTTILGMTLITGLSHAGPFDYIHLVDQARAGPSPSPLPPAPSAASLPAAPAAPKHWVASQFLPGPGRWISTVDNFDGLVGVANIQGTGKDNKGNTLDWGVDLRAMQGVYIGRDGLSHRGTFGMTWLDVYSGSGPTRMQIHELHFPFHGDVGSGHPNPVANEMDPAFGPFWTGPVPDASLTGSPFTSLMTLAYADAPQHDHFQTGASTSVTAKASVHVDWMPGPAGNFAPLEPAVAYQVRDTVAGFAGEYILSQAHAVFSITTQVSATDTTPFTFTASPDGQRVLFAQVGHEVNGLFMR